jgi:methylmalonyl-CoA mutase N-terminal domain/subunit
MVALRTQQIIAHESGVTDTVDPMGGSYHVEYLTNEIEEKAAEYIEQIEGMGGAVAAIEKGFMQREITESAYRFQKEAEAKQRIIVGVNDFLSEEETPVKTLQVDRVVERKLVERLKEIKRQRSETRVKESLTNLRHGAEQDGVNLMPLILEAVKQYATLGEICSTLRDVFGEYKPPSIF